MHPSHQVDTGIVMIGPAVTQDDHRRLAVDGVAVLLLKIFEGLTVIGRTKPDLVENLRYRHLDVLFLDDVADLAQMIREREGPQGRDHFVQRIQEQEEEPRGGRNRTRDIANHHNSRPLDLRLLPNRIERNAVMRHVPAQGTTDIEDTSPGPFAATVVTGRKFFRHLAHQFLHALEVTLLDCGKGGLRQKFFAQLFTIGTRV